MARLNKNFKKDTTLCSLKESLFKVTNIQIKSTIIKSIYHANTTDKETYVTM